MFGGFLYICNVLLVRSHNKEYDPGDVSGCQGWQLGGWNVHSGNITGLQSSILELRVNLVRDGKVGGV
jgi:hypothetical protein